MSGDNEDDKGAEVTVELDLGPETTVEVQPPVPEPKPGEPVAVEVAAEPAPAPAPQPVPDPTIELRQQLEELSRKTEEERRAREDETRRRTEAEQNLLRVAAEKEARDRELVDARLQAVTSAMAAEEAEMERAESMMRHATAKKDSTLLVQAQKAMISISARIEKLKEGQEALTEQREQLSKRPPITPPQNATPTRDQLLGKYSPRTQEYLRNRDASWLTDQKAQNLLVSAHYAARAQGLQVDTEAYFQAIDKHMGYGQQAPDPAPAPAAAAPKPAPKSAPAAPPTSKAASVPTGNKIQVVLKPSEVETAKNLGITPAEYARRKHIMSQPGWSGPRFGQNN